MTEEEAGQQTERDEGFGQGTYQDLLDRVTQVMQDLAPSLSFRVSGDENRSRLRVNIQFESPDNIGLFLGRGCCNLKMLQHYIRAQQIFPHNRYSEIVIFKGNGQNQSFWDRNINKRDD